MGQKVNPNGFRFGITKEHNATWFADKKSFAKYLHQDSKIREYFTKFTRKYQLGNIQIKRSQKEEVTVFLHSATPGVILGQGGENIKKMIIDVKKHLKDKKINLKIEVVLIEKPSLNATLMAEEIAVALENRGSFRVAQKQAIRKILQGGATGVKTRVSGRLNGVDMARTEGYQQGIISLHTLRQDVDYALALAHTTYGVLGVKVWISKGEILKTKNKINEGGE
ncbi:MAG: 30S ribosomal protein S3 [Mycoplasma sp.]|nr:30S ribosomal protein S3 [Mycoplasma sp.]